MHRRITRESVHVYRLVEHFPEFADTIAKSSFAVTRAPGSQTMELFDWINQEFLQVPFSGPTRGVNCIGANEADEKSGCPASAPSASTKKTGEEEEEEEEDERVWVDAHTHGRAHRNAMVCG